MQDDWLNEIFLPLRLSLHKHRLRLAQAVSGLGHQNLSNYNSSCKEACSVPAQCISTAHSFFFASATQIVNDQKM